MPDVGDGVDRREVLGIMGGAAAWRLAVRAQQLTLPVIGFLNGVSADLSENYVRPFIQGLSETGFVEGHDPPVMPYDLADWLDEISALVV